MVFPSFSCPSHLEKRQRGGIGFKTRTLKFFPEWSLEQSSEPGFLCGVQSKSVTPMSQLAPMGGGRLHAGL
jgi:hypothetical protein